MRLSKIDITDVPPVKKFTVEGLSSTVILAGPNGVGKTRLVQALLRHLQKPRGAESVRLIIEATTPEERKDWGQRVIDSADDAQAAKFTASLQKNRRRTKWRSSVINFESDRSIQKITPFQFSWNITDPWEEDVGWNTTFGGLRARFDDTLHSIFRKVQSQRDRIAKRAEQLMEQGKTTMELKRFKDPLEPFKQAFSQLVSPKELLNADPKKQHLDYSYEGQTFPITSLSSGEQEVINIVFDFILRSPSHSIVIFDEPELHLHPELSFKLLRTLEAVGESNQFIFCTHSPDIITASLEHSVIFIAPPTAERPNQAIPVTEDDETNQALRMLGHSVGIITLGRQIVLIEGTHASLDKQVYGAIIRNKYPGLVLVPSGGKSTINSFASISSQVLEKTIWGVDFFMLCDGDSMPSCPEANPATPTIQRLRTLPKYHLENYFLDEQTLARVFSQMDPGDSWLTSPAGIREKLREIASGLVSYAVALHVAAMFRQRVGNLDIMPKDCHGKTKQEVTDLLAQRATEEQVRIQDAISQQELNNAISQRFDLLESSVQSDGDEWKSLIPGRPILHTFAAQAGLQVGRLKTLYLKEAKGDGFAVFEDILDIFDHFSSFEEC